MRQHTTQIGDRYEPRPPELVPVPNIETGGGVDLPGHPPRVPDCARRYWQLLNLSDWIAVAQLNDPFAGMYWVVNTIVQPSIGSMLIVA